MKVFVRCDASAAIGSGHVMRCLTIAGALALRKAEVQFICREYPGDLCDFIEGKGFPVHRLSGNGSLECPDQFWERDAEETGEVVRSEGGGEWLIVDHYGLDERWETRLRKSCARILVIDDLADRAHDCDLLLDQNLYEDMVSRYKGLVPKGCRTFLGPRYALLRPEFNEARKTLRERDGTVRCILVSFGGSDPTNETAKALDAARTIDRNEIFWEIVAGASNPHTETLRKICSALPNCTLHTQVSTMASMMAHADLAWGGGGVTTWERCFLGLPSITVVVAENQDLTTAAVAATGATWNLGRHRDVSSDMLADATVELLRDPSRVRQMSRRALSLMGDPTQEAHPLVEIMTGDQSA